MTNKQKHALFEKEVRAQLRRVNLEHWRVRIESDTEMETMGSTRTTCGACQAHVKFNPNHHPNRAEIIDTARHEVFHMLLAPLVLACLDREDAHRREVVEEELVLRLVRLTNGL